MKILLFFIMGLLIASQNVLADDKATADILRQGSVSWDGANVQYPDGMAEISIVKISVPQGVKIPLHCHPVPLAAYVLEGTLEVIKSSGEKKIFRQGEAFIEVMNTWHKGSGVGKDTELIVFYAGKKDLPLSINMNGDPALASTCN